MRDDDDAKASASGVAARFVDQAAVDEPRDARGVWKKDREGPDPREGVSRRRKRHTDFEGERAPCGEKVEARRLKRATEARGGGGRLLPTIGWSGGGADEAVGGSAAIRPAELAGDILIFLQGTRR